MQKLVEESGVVMFLRYWSFQVAVHLPQEYAKNTSEWTNLKIAAGILFGRYIQVQVLMTGPDSFMF